MYLCPNATLNPPTPPSPATKKKKNFRTQNKLPPLILANYLMNPPPPKAGEIVWGVKCDSPPPPLLPLLFVFGGWKILLVPDGRCEGQWSVGYRRSGEKGGGRGGGNPSPQERHPYPRNRNRFWWVNITFLYEAWLFLVLSWLGYRVIEPREYISSKWSTA